MTPQKKLLRSLFTIVAVIFASGALARATTYTFTGNTTNTSYNWSTASGWDLTPTSGSTTELVFGTGGTLPVGVVSNNNISGTFLLNKLTTNNAGQSFTISGNQLNFVSNGATTPTISLTGPQVTMSGPVNFGNDINIGGSGDIMFSASGNITNSGGAVITKSGGGTMRIESNNPGYTGNFSVTGGTLQIGNNGNAGDAGSGTVTLSGGGSFVLRRNAVTLNNTITGTGDVKFQTRSSSSATISKANTYTGNTTLEPASSGYIGGIKLGIDDGLSTTTALTINNNGASVQTFDLNGHNQKLGSIATGTGGNITNSIITNTGTAKTLEISSATGSTNYAGLISGAISLTKSGDSTQILSGANTYNGATTINAGTLQIGNGSDAGSIGSASSITNNGSLVYNVGTGNRTLGAVISGTGSLTQNSAGVLTLSANNTYTGATTISAGTLQIGNGSDAGSIGSTSSITNNGSLVYNVGTGNRTLGIVISGTGTLTQNSAGGILTLSANNTYNGGTTIKNGSIILGGGNDRLKTTSSVTLGDTSTSGKLVLGDGTARNQTLAGLTTIGSGGSVVGGASSNSTLTLNISGSNSFGGTLGGAGTNENNLALTKTGAGTLTLTGSNTYTGATTVNAGTLVLANTSVLPTNNSISLAGTSTLEIATDSSLDNTVSLSTNSNNNYTLKLNRATDGAAVNQTFQLVAFGNAIHNVQAGSHVNIGSTPTLYLNGVELSGGGNGTVTLNPTTANISATTVKATNVATAKTLVLGGTSAGNEITGVISDGTGGRVVSITKSNSSTWTLTGVSTYTGNTTVSGGNLTVSGSGRLANTGNVIITSGGSLLIGNTNAITGNTTTVTMNGTIGIAAGVSSSNQTFGALTLSANSTLDFASGANNVMRFASFNNAGSGILSITNWLPTTHLVFDIQVASGDWTKFDFGSGLQTSQITYSGAGGGYEIIAIPEPGTIVAGALLLGCLILLERWRPIRLKHQGCDSKKIPGTDGFC